MPKDLVPYLGRLVIDREFEVTVKDPDLPYDVALRVRVDGGVPQVVELVCSQRKGGLPVDGRGLRNIPVGELLADAVRDRARDSQNHRQKPLAEGERFKGPLSTPTQTRAHITDELLKEVADVYRSAVALGRPVETVAEYFSEARPNGTVPRNTARRWVVEARRRGFLEPSKRSLSADE